MPLRGYGPDLNHSEKLEVNEWSSIALSWKNNKLSWAIIPGTNRVYPHTKIMYSMIHL